jgi:glycosyltransferase involved in cell wall biosynthesis
MKPTLIFTVTNDLVYDQRMQRICTSLADNGYQVTLVGRLRAGSPSLESQPFQQVRLTCYFEKGKLFYLEYNIRLLVWLLRQQADGICSIDLDTLLPGLIASRLRGKPLIYDAHEYFTETPEVERRLVVKRVWEWVARLGIPRTTLAYTVGPELANLFEKRYQVPFSVVRNVPFPQANFTQPKSTNPQKILLYQGVLNEGRGLEYLLEAMTEVEGAELWLAGEGDLSQELRAQAERLQLGGKVRFLGYLRPAELQKITPQAWLGFNLLEARGLSYYYSLANKAFDYIQAGVPSVQMDFPEYRKLQEEYQVFYLLPKLETKPLTALIQRALQEEPHREQLATNCRSAREVLNWKHEEQKLLGLYAGLFKGEWV